ncbi:hypothetical protein [Natrinema altunense]|uniref:hypothetical protein n=1 Tax=Natrinema altunense TaxID=222984 RepID=UPI001186CF9D|nr:hypothetical protein [Natrinema altunense]
MDLDEAFMYWFGVFAASLFVAIVPLYLYTVFTDFPRFSTMVLVVVVVPPLLMYAASNWFESDGGENR